MSQNKNYYSLISGFLRSCEIFPDRHALDVGGACYTYDELGHRVSSIAGTICSADDMRTGVVALLAHRSITAYVGVLGILAAGRGYIPLNPKFPVERTARMFLLSEANKIIVGKECLEFLDELLPILSDPVTLICPDIDDVTRLRERNPRHSFIASTELNTGNGLPDEPETDPAETAYLLFTSGSTGIPKGVPISHRNVVSYVQYVADRYSITEEDRFSQMFDLTFDLSVHDMFVCWERGACLCSVPEKMLLAPGKYIRQKNITMWFSVPSVGIIMNRMKALKPDAFPSLRYSLFCGEPLPAAIADTWQKAAPGSRIENLYGPTEATIAISAYQWSPEKSADESVNGIVPIGWIFPSQEERVVSTDSAAVSTGEAGELYLSGSQVTGGYLNNPEKTRQQFVRLSDTGNALWYRTGDLVKQNEEGCLFYLGRIDNQVQIRGYRVELEEIDSAIRDASSCDQAVAVAWPLNDGRAGGVYGFLTSDCTMTETQIIGAVKEHVPDYMVPAEIFFLEHMPVNANGKVDRNQLSKIIEERQNGRP